MQEWITIIGARENNLKNITVRIPKKQLVVLTGLSGSGKSTLAFDTLQRECMRQYMESMGMVTHFLSRPKVDRIEGLSPSISVDQRQSNHNPRSTVGTLTEVFTYLRVLYAKLGERPCPNCGQLVPPFFASSSGSAATAFGDSVGSTSDLTGGYSQFDEMTDLTPADPGVITNDIAPAITTATFPCPHCQGPVPQLTMAHFSFNKPEGACPTCTGLGVIAQPNLAAILNEELTLAEGAVVAWEPQLAKFYCNALVAAGEYYGFKFDPTLPVKDYTPIMRDLLLYGVYAPEFQRHFPHVTPPSNNLNGRFEGVITGMMRRYADHTINDSTREKIARCLTEQTCPECHGARLRAESRPVRVHGRTIIDLAAASLQEVATWLQELPAVVSGEGLLVVRPIFDDLTERMKRLLDVGVGYLSMARPAASLSGGEVQRLRLAALLGSGLTGVLYVLDEPTTGLHPRDTARLLRVLQQLRDLSNTVLVIEHDPDIMRAADYIIDIGPGAGLDGGSVVVAGTPAEVAQCSTSATGRYLSGVTDVVTPMQRRSGNGRKLTIHGACEHNLQDITISLPLGTFTTLTGVSGSGKSTLLFDILAKAAAQRYFNAADTPGKHRQITGWEHVDKVITIDQTAIGRIPRSNPATYTEAFAAIRTLYSRLPAAQERGLQARHFSFNVAGGRCEQCQGAGVLSIKMHFLPEVQVRCPVCRGRRFKPEVLSVQFKGQHIASVLNMSIAAATDLFIDTPEVYRHLCLLVDVGLGYLQLGQPAPTLSGGEAQRIKLARELVRKTKGHTLYLLDEPTIGLHPHDVQRLLLLLQRLVDAGNTVVVIEHNLDVIRIADHIIDFGPEGGGAGGRVVACGTPEEVAQVADSHTGAYLRG